MIALDTHALVWYLSNPARLPSKARRLLDAAVKGTDPLAVSCISVWEVAMLVTHGRLLLTIDVETWIANVEALRFLKFVPVDDRIATRSVRLKDFPNRDPADRMIVATAIGLGATLVTGDRRLRSYSPVTTVWD